MPAPRYHRCAYLRVHDLEPHAGDLVVETEFAGRQGVVGFVDPRGRCAPAQGEVAAVGGADGTGGGVVLGEQLAPRLAEPGAAEAVGQGDRGCRLVEAEVLRGLIVGGQCAGPGKGVEQPQCGCAGAVAGWWGR